MAVLFANTVRDASGHLNFSNLNCQFGGLDASLRL